MRGVGIVLTFGLPFGRGKVDGTKSPAGFVPSGFPFYRGLHQQPCTMFFQVFCAAFLAVITKEILFAAVRTIREWKRAADVIDEESKRMQDLTPSDE